MALVSLQPGLDPHNWEGSTGIATFSPIFDALTSFDAEGRLQPALARSWRQLNETTWEFQLQDDVKFHNGEPLDASAVQFSFERVLNPANKLPLGKDLGTISSVEAAAPATVIIVTRVPDPLLPRRTSLLYILPPQYFQEVGQEKFSQGLIGTGSFKLKRLERDRRLALEAVGNPWRGMAKVERLNLLVMPEPSTRVAALRAGDVDIAMEVPPAEVEALQSEGMNILSQGLARVQFIDLYQPSGPQADKRVRQAMNYAVDKAAIVERLFHGFGKVPTQLVGPGATGYNPNIIGYPYDPEKARELLWGAGFPEGFETKMATLPVLNSSAELVQDFLQRIGIEVELETIDFATFIQKHNQGGRTPLWYWGSDYTLLMDADFAFQFHSKAVPEPLRRSNDSRVDQLFRESRFELDSQKRGKLLQEIAEIIHEEAYELPVYQAQYIVATRNSIQGVVVLPNASLNFDKATKVK